MVDKTVYYRNKDKTPDQFHMWFKNIVPDVSYGAKHLLSSGKDFIKNE
jgi:hypothetical protein